MTRLRTLFVKIQTLFVLRALILQAKGDLLEIDCGGPDTGHTTIIGCFASLGNTKYINFKNGAMPGPGKNTKIGMIDFKSCILTVELEDPLTPGYYQCGILLPGGANQTRYAIYSAFNVSFTAAKQRNDTQKGLGSLPSSVNESRFMNGSETQGGERKSLGVPINMLICLSIGTIISIIMATAASTWAYFARYRRKIVPISSSKESEAWRFSCPLDGSFYKSTSLDGGEVQIEVPPPMELIPAESITRYTSKYPSYQKSGCACVKSPIQHKEQFV